MRAATALAAHDFMAQANIPMPEAIADGALPAMIRETVYAEDLHRLVDVCMQWTLGDYDDGLDCSAYYDPQSPWYNVIYGAYGLRSYKHDGAAWGFHRDGRPNFPELIEVTKIDYNFLTAGQFGCPAARMCFEGAFSGVRQESGWWVADTSATIPSGLHDFTNTLGNPMAYVIYGVPPQSLLEGRDQFEPVPMRGQLYMRQMTAGPQPITMAWGALCPDPAGGALLESILEVMRQHYLPITAQPG
ncbi:MAG: hypothetical protein U0802_11965 [Candidatus Binatia bacterium]